LSSVGLRINTLIKLIEGLIPGKFVFLKRSSEKPEIFL